MDWADCWGLYFEKDGRVYTAADSEYIRLFKEKSPLFPENALHFLLIGTNTVVDILMKGFPTVEILE